jgi:hypothetical protein
MINVYEYVRFNMFVANTDVSDLWLQSYDEKAYLLLRQTTR